MAVQVDRVVKKALEMFDFINQDMEYESSVRGICVFNLHPKSSFHIGPSCHFNYNSDWDSTQETPYTSAVSFSNKSVYRSLVTIYWGNSLSGGLQILN